MAALFFQACHGHAGDAARSYFGEGSKVAANIEGKAVHRYPTPDPHTDGCYFPVGDPRSREALPPAGGDVERCADPDEQFLEGTQIDVQILAVPAQVEDGITHKLAGAMISGLATAIRRDHGVREMGGAAEAGLVGGPADCINGFVLQEKELVGNGASAALGCETLLQGEGLRVFHPAQPLDGDWVSGFFRRM